MTADPDLSNSGLRPNTLITNKKAVHCSMDRRWSGMFAEWTF